MKASTLTFTASATDADIPANTLTFSLSGSLPGRGHDRRHHRRVHLDAHRGAGARLLHASTVIVSARCAVPTARRSRCTVDEVNDAPVLAAIGNQTVDEDDDADVHGQGHRRGHPGQHADVQSGGGSRRGPASTAGGAFSWTPTEAQGPGSFTFTVKVTDNGTPSLSDEESITVTVNEVNLPPVLTAIGNKSVSWGQTLSFTATATDPDIPANTLTFSLVGAPVGAAINGSSGAFSWTPGPTQIGGHTFTVRVTDNGSPAYSDEETITVTVIARPTGLIYSGDAAEQYSDLASLSATLIDTLSGAALPGKIVRFTIGSQSVDDETDSAGVGQARLSRLRRRPVPTRWVQCSLVILIIRRAVTPIRSPSPRKTPW